MKWHFMHLAVPEIQAEVLLKKCILESDTKLLPTLFDTLFALFDILKRRVGGISTFKFSPPSIKCHNVLIVPNISGFTLHQWKRQVNL